MKETKPEHSRIRVDKFLTKLYKFLNAFDDYWHFH